MKLKTKQRISDFLDCEISKSDLEELLQSAKKNKRIARLYSEYLLVQNCIRGGVNYSTKFDIADKVMQNIAPKPNILRFIPKYAPQLAIAASTFLAITLGVYFYIPEKTDHLVANPPEALIKKQDPMNLKFNQKFLNKVGSLSATDKYSDELSISPLTVLNIETQEYIKPDDIYISPLISESIFEASATLEVSQ